MSIPEKNPARLVANVGILSALAMILSFLEGLIPLVVIAPGCKLGLANIVTLFALYRLGFREALLITLIRCSLSALLFGSGMSLLFSLAGGLLSTCMMALCMRSKSVSPIGTSIAGAAMHNTVQVSIAALIMQTPGLFFYLPALLLLSIPLGGAIALVYLPFRRIMPEVNH